MTDTNNFFDALQTGHAPSQFGAPQTAASGPLTIQELNQPPTAISSHDARYDSLNARLSKLEKMVELVLANQKIVITNQQTMASGLQRANLEANSEFDKLKGCASYKDLVPRAPTGPFNGYSLNNAPVPQPPPQQLQPQLQPPQGLQQPPPQQPQRDNNYFYAQQSPDLADSDLSLKRQKASKSMSQSEMDMESPSNLSADIQSLVTQDPERFIFKEAPKSIKEIWEEYNTTIKTLEDSAGKAWRKSRTTSKKYNRRKKIYKWIESGIEKGYTDEQCIAILEEYRISKNRSISLLMDKNDFPEL